MIINSYQNGNYTGTLYDDGTKVRETKDDRFIAEYPESIDLKITNYCDMGAICGYCHEASHVHGRHADLVQTAEILSGLPRGVEIAIGGGNPLAHPQIVSFLQELKHRGLVANLTVNHLHLRQYQELIDTILRNKLVYGLGISYRRGYDIQMIRHYMSYDNAVMHVIAGVDDPVDILDVLSQCNTKKVLILGYKDFRKGVSWRAFSDVDKRLQKWFNRLPTFVANVTRAGGVVSFDNLGITQLNPSRLMSKERWNEIYQGDDGTHTFYIDAVRKEFSLSSTASIRHKWDWRSAPEMFSLIQV